MIPLLYLKEIYMWGNDTTVVMQDKKKCDKKTTFFDQDLESVINTVHLNLQRMIIK